MNFRKDKLAGGSGNTLMDKGADNRRHAMCTLWQIDNVKRCMVMDRH